MENFQVIFFKEKIYVILDSLSNKYRLLNFGKCCESEYFVTDTSHVNA